MTTYEIPFSPQPQSFTIALNGGSYRLTTRWCAPMLAWTLDIADADNVPMVQGLPLVTGTDILKQLAYLGIKGSIRVQSSGEITKVPGLAELGISGLVFFITP